MTHFKTTFTIVLILGLFHFNPLAAQFSGQVVNFKLNKYNSSNNGQKLTVNDGERLATIHLRGYTPANEFQTASAIRSIVTGVPAAGILPARLDFHNGQSNLFDMRRMTILNNGNIGIGFPQDFDPVTLFDVNGDARVRGSRIFLQDPNDVWGGEALSHVITDCDAIPLPNANGLAINSGGGFTDGVIVDGPGLEICETLEANCLVAEENIASRMGNIYALGGEAIADPCALPAEGDFVAMGANSDFIAHHGNFTADEGDFLAEGNNGDFIARYGNFMAAGMDGNGDFVAQNADGDFTAQGLNGDFRAEGDNGNFIALGDNGSFIAQGNEGDFRTEGENGHFIANRGDIIARGLSGIGEGDIISEQGDFVLSNGVSGGRAMTRTDAGGFGAPEVLTLNLEGDFSGGVRVDGPGLIVGDGAAFTGNANGHELAVAGSIIAEEVVVKLQTNWPDYVFDEDYPKPNLKKWEAFVKKHKHLPGMPSEKELQEKGGVEVGEMQRLLLEKVEQLTLIILEQQKEIDNLKTAMNK